MIDCPLQSGLKSLKVAFLTAPNVKPWSVKKVRVPRYDQKPKSGYEWIFDVYENEEREWVIFECAKQLLFI